jgi:hypothetical protein
MGQLIYNNYSSEFKPKSLKKGEVARFRVIGSESQVQTLLQLPYEDYIMDEGTGEMIQIGAIKRLRAEGKPEFYFIHLNEIQQRCWVLQGGKKEDNEIYRFLQRCNFNKSNENRDDANEPIIEEFDSNSAIKKKKARRDAIRAAVNIAAEMTDKEVRDYYGGDVTTDIDALRLRVEEEAETVPSKFIIKKAKDEVVDLRAKIEEADKKGGIINFDQELNEWSDADGNLLMKCEKRICHGKSVDFVKWVESGEGKDMMDVILEKLS